MKGQRCLAKANSINSWGNSDENKLCLCVCVGQNEKREARDHYNGCG